MISIQSIHRHLARLAILTALAFPAGGGEYISGRVVEKVVIPACQRGADWWPPVLAVIVECEDQRGEMYLMWFAADGERWMAIEPGEWVGEWVE